MSETLSLRVSSLTRTPPRRAPRRGSGRAAAPRAGSGCRSRRGRSFRSRRHAVPRSTCLRRRPLILRTGAVPHGPHWGDSVSSRAVHCHDPGCWSPDRDPARLRTSLARSGRTHGERASHGDSAHLAPSVPQSGRGDPRWNCWSTASAAATPQEMLGDPRTVRVTGDDDRRRATGAPRTPTPSSTPSDYRDRPGPRGVLLVQPHLRQRRPRPVAAAAALHGRQPRPLDAARRAAGRTPHGPAVRRARPARRAQPHRAADRRGLRGRPRPGGLAVRGHRRLRRRGKSWLGFLSAGAAAAGGAQPGRRLALAAAGARRAHRPAVVPVQPHLERVRVPAPADRRRRRGRRDGRTPTGADRRAPALGRPGLLVRPPARRPAARRAHRRRASSPSPPPSARPPPGTTAAAAARAARRPRLGCSRRLLVAGAARRAVGGLPPRPQRDAGSTAALDRAARHAACPAPRSPCSSSPPLYAGWSRPGWASAGLAPRRRHLRRPRPRPGRCSSSPSPCVALRPVPAAHRDAAHRPARPRRPRRRDARLRARRGDVRRRRPARRRLARRRRHPRHGRRLHRRAARAADLAGLRHPACCWSLLLVLAAVLAVRTWRRARAARGRRSRRDYAGRAAGRRPHPADRRHPRPRRAHRLRALARRRRLRRHPAARRGRRRRGLGQRRGARAGRATAPAPFVAGAPPRPRRRSAPG